MHVDGETGPKIAPDYFEHHPPQAEADRIAQHYRRAFYNIMTGAALGFKTGLVNNPTEWWHWGRGDQLSEKVRGRRRAYYGLAEPA